MAAGQRDLRLKKTNNAWVSKGQNLPWHWHCWCLLKQRFFVLTRLRAGFSFSADNDVGGPLGYGGPVDTARRATGN